MAHVTRRDVLKTGAAGAAALIANRPVAVRAQSKEPIPIGTLCPLTGAGGAYGPDMQKAIVSVAERINKGGGIHGRPIQLFHEDSQTNPEAAVRAARKLIDVNKVVALMSTFASAVTLAVKPLAVESKVFYISVSGADAVTEGNHGGYIARTQPNTKLQGQVYGKWVVSRKEWKRVALMTLQTPFAVPFGDNFTATVKSAGLTVTDSLIYEDKKASYRSEITRVLATNPELIMLLGYTPDSVVMAKELYRAAYKGAVLGPAFAINAKFVEGAGAEVAEGVWAIDPAPSFDSPAYKQFDRRRPPGRQEPLRAPVVGSHDPGRPRPGRPPRRGVGHGHQGHPANDLESAGHRRHLLRGRRAPPGRGQEDQLRGGVGLVRLRRHRRHPVAPLRRLPGPERQDRASGDHQSLSGCRRSRSTCSTGS